MAYLPQVFLPLVTLDLRGVADAEGVAVGEAVVLDAATELDVAVAVEEGVTLDTGAVALVAGATTLSKRSSSSSKPKPIRATNSSPTGGSPVPTSAWSATTGGGLTLATGRACVIVPAARPTAAMAPAAAFAPLTILVKESLGLGLLAGELGLRLLGLRLDRVDLRTRDFLARISRSSKSTRARASTASLTSTSRSMRAASSEAYAHII
jgi:hypothetical protein